ncbi:glycoside hydrolase family 43 protein [Mycetocola miduiensis]|uniref:Glycosyl hydrolases family 43 n=1 Tax=Mycetocola miduiensis TaxID=995034 RepID=A0A1I4ZNG8_9MICO|nr:glycoside hydrolase family 43 protein [Mycetocola miduiensis]SFN51811.1 Glycosyl hydrolases family 43 [Mycetocola miduiensis]
MNQAKRAVALGAVFGVLAGAFVGCAPQPAPASDPVSKLEPFLIDQDFADPDILEADGKYVAFATNTRGVNVQFATSDDRAEWNVSLEDALPQLPGWATSGRTWAPDVTALPAGGYVLYFVAQHSESNRQCIGAATSATVTGPYSAVAGEPLVCTLDEGGSIDPATFTDDDGTRYLIWKNDGNCCSMDTWIQLNPLTPDGTQLAGPATKLFKQSEPWEGQLVEAPTLVKHGDTYLVFYSANDYGSDQYAVGVASAPAITGPYGKQPTPLLSSESSDGRYIGPGGQDVLRTPDGDVMFFHGWDELVIYRGMYSLPLDWTGDLPSVRLP